MKTDSIPSLFCLVPFTNQLQGPATMSNLTTLGLLVLVLVVGGSVQQLGGKDQSLGSYGPLVSLLGIIVGANLIFLSDKMTGSPVAVFLGTMTSLAMTYLRYNLAMVGLFTVSSAIMVYVGAGTATSLALSIGLFVILLLGVAMITLGVHGGLN